MINRRKLLKSALGGAAAGIALPACQAQPSSPARVMTVTGWLPAGQMGLTLSHEHLFADLRPVSEQVATPAPPDLDDVAAAVLPHLQQIYDLGCRTLIDATAAHAGRNASVVRRLSEDSGLNMLMPTGVYLAAGERFVPDYARTEDAQVLAARWIGEWQDGIGETDVRPGFMKLGTDGGEPTPLEEKTIRAAAMTHLETGLPIAVHTSPWSAVEPGHNGLSALRQVEILTDMGVSPGAWIWVHAQNESDRSHHLSLARRGGYISLDGYRAERTADYIAMIEPLREAGLLSQLLLSQDAGWYSAAEPGGGDFSPFAPILATLIPALREAGFSQAEIDTLFIANPARAFAIEVRPA